MTDQFASYVESAISGNGKEPDNYLLCIMDGRLEGGDISGALTIADFALEHAWSDRRPGRGNIAKRVVEAVTTHANRPGSPVSLADLTATERMTRGKDMPNGVRAALFRAYAASLRRDGFKSEAGLWSARAATLLAG